MKLGGECSFEANRTAYVKAGCQERCLIRLGLVRAEVVRWSRAKYEDSD